MCEFEESCVCRSEPEANRLLRESSEHCKELSLELFYYYYFYFTYMSVLYHVYAVPRKGDV